MLPSIRSVALLTFVAAALSGCSIFSKSPAPAQTQVAPTPQEAAPVPAQKASAAVSAPVQTPEAIPVVRVAEPVKSEPIPPARPLPEPATPVPAAQSSAPAATAVAAGAASSVLVPGFYINVGLFAVPANATKAFQKLEQAGLPVFTDVTDSKKGKLTRVRVGPFNTRAQADTAAKKIQGLKLEAVVFKH